MAAKSSIYRYSELQAIASLRSDCLTSEVREICMLRSVEPER